MAKRVAFDPRVVEQRVGNLEPSQPCDERRDVIEILAREDRDRLEKNAPLCLRGPIADEIEEVLEPAQPRLEEVGASRLDAVDLRVRPMDAGREHVEPCVEKLGEIAAIGEPHPRGAELDLLVSEPASLRDQLGQILAHRRFVPRDQHASFALRVRARKLVSPELDGTKPRAASGLRVRTEDACEVAAVANVEVDDIRHADARVPGEVRILGGLVVEQVFEIGVGHRDRARPQLNGEGVQEALDDRAGRAGVGEHQVEATRRHETRTPRAMTKDAHGEGRPANVFEREPDDRVELDSAEHHAPSYGGTAGNGPEHGRERRHACLGARRTLLHPGSVPQGHRRRLASPWSRAETTEVTFSSRRVRVGGRCRRPCPSCAACVETQSPSAEEVLSSIDADEVILGGGDALAWPHLATFLLAAVKPERRIWVEAPAASFTEAALSRLAASGVFGVVVQIEATGGATRTLGVGDGERAIAFAEQRGLETRARVCVRPRTFGIVVPLAQRLAPRRVSLEILRQDHDREPLAIPREAVEATLRAAPNVRFAGDRRVDAGYLPPCAVPGTFAENPAPWVEVLGQSIEPNRTLAACATCVLADHCSFRDAGALPEEATPIASKPTTANRTRAVGPRPSTATDGVRCTAPWTTMMQLDPSGDVTQCCSEWTVGSRGDRRLESFVDIWNNASYRAARRAMKRGPIDALCRPICPRLYDGQLAERRPTKAHGSPAFVRNQALLAEDLAEGREEARCLPTTLGFAPSTYCNYDCIMCDHGRTPRRDLPDDAWEELPRFMPTLQTLVLIGGEPLANPRVMRFLREFDAARWPDAGISLTTNGSLLTEAVLARLGRCTFADVSVSLNAGTAAVYEEVQRGLPLDVVLGNLDALIEFRRSRPKPFQLRTSFVVQPANAHTLIPFGELTAARGIGIRLLPLTIDRGGPLDFYADPDAVQRVIVELDRFEEWSKRVQPAWCLEIAAVRHAIQATHHQRSERMVRSLPVVRSSS